MFKLNYRWRRQQPLVVACAFIPTQCTPLLNRSLHAHVHDKCYYCAWAASWHFWQQLSTFANLRFQFAHVGGTCALCFSDTPALCEKQTRHVCSVSLQRLSIQRGSLLVHWCQGMTWLQWILRGRTRVSSGAAATRPSLNANYANYQFLHLYVR
jgi:hypothetical protein